MKRKRLGRPHGMTARPQGAANAPPDMAEDSDWLDAIRREMALLQDAQREEMLNTLRAEFRPRPAGTRHSYSVDEVATMLGKTPYTVREWCRAGRLHASKRQERRGGAERWSIAAEELARYQDDGLLPAACPDAQ